jgi:hypothetical protein
VHESESVSSDILLRNVGTKMLLLTILFVASVKS